MLDPQAREAIEHALAYLESLPEHVWTIEAQELREHLEACLA